MPASAADHRQKIGQFYPLAVQISVRKQKRQSWPNVQPCSLKKELGSWCGCVSVVMLYTLLLLLLLLCQDIETNPGPSDYLHDTAHDSYNYRHYAGHDSNYRHDTAHDNYNDYNSYVSQQVQSSLDSQLSNFMSFLRSHANDLCQKMEDKLKTIEVAIDRLSDDVSTLREWIQHDSSEINELKNNQKHMGSRLDRIERELEELEKDSRLRTLRFIGVREEGYENSQQSTQLILDLLNSHSPSRRWHPADVERAHRVGGRRLHRDSPRTLLVYMHRWGDKMEIFSDKTLRDHLRNDIIKVSADLTPPVTWKKYNTTANRGRWPTSEVGECMWRSPVKDNFKTADLPAETSQLLSSPGRTETTGRKGPNAWIPHLQPLTGPHKRSASIR